MVVIYFMNFLINKSYNKVYSETLITTY